MAKTMPPRTPAKRDRFLRALRRIAPDRTEAVDPRDVPLENEFYGRLGDRWWDLGGSLSSLHEMTPARAAYFDGVFTAALGENRRRSGLFADVGCGGGILTEAMSRRGYSMIGLDISSGAVAAANRHAAREQLEIRYARGSAYGIPFPSGRITGVIASDVLEHLSDLPRAISELSRILAPGGVLVFDTVNRTLLSLVGAIGVAQNWLRILPPRTHAWRLFITPGELISVLDRFGLETREVRGLSPTGNPVQLFFRLWRRRSLGVYTISRDTRISYIGYAVKAGKKEG